MSYAKVDSAGKTRLPSYLIRVMTGLFPKLHVQTEMRKTKDFLQKWKVQRTDWTILQDYCANTGKAVWKRQHFLSCVSCRRCMIHRMRKRSGKQLLPI